MKIIPLFTHAGIEICKAEFEKGEEESMECSPTTKASREFYITIEKQILRDLASGILAEVIELSDHGYTNQRARKSLKHITGYVMKLVEILGEGEVT